MIASCRCRFRCPQSPFLRSSLDHALFGRYAMVKWFSIPNVAQRSWENAEDNLSLEFVRPWSNPSAFSGSRKTENTNLHAVSLKQNLGVVMARRWCKRCGTRADQEGKCSPYCFHPTGLQKANGCCQGHGCCVVLIKTMWNPIDIVQIGLQRKDSYLRLFNLQNQSGHTPPTHEFLLRLAFYFVQRSLHTHLY